MSAFGNTHVEVLDDRSTILIENVFLAKFAELCATVVEHHIGGLVQRVSLILAFLVDMATRDVVDRLWMIMIEDDGTWPCHQVAGVRCP